MIPIGVLVIVLSIKVTEPTSWPVVPPAEMSIPFWQLLMLIPWYTQPQSQSWLMAVTQLLKTRFRIVNCWFPMEAPTIPPLKVTSVMKPAEPRDCQKELATNAHTQTYHFHKRV